MNSPVIKILYGPPGTGKTWKAAIDAVRTIYPSISSDKIDEAHKTLVNSHQIIWVTFHPSYSYEDFIEGFRPVEKNGSIVYEIKPGPLKLACKQASMNVHPSAYFIKGQELESSSGQHYEVVDCDRGAVVVRNVRSTDKGFGKHTPVSFWVLNRLLTAGYTSTSLGIPGSRSQEQQEVVSATEVDKQTIFGMTGPLRAVWEEVEHNQAAHSIGAPVVLVIDEINRADISSVFGELITLLEPNKRLGNTEERRVILPYSQELFGVPPNLHIIATMNSTDRSIAILDHALRRRFTFEEIPPMPELCPSNYGGIDLSRLLIKWNNRITALLSREHRIGHAYFIENRLEEARNTENLSNDDDGRLKTIANVLRKNILPLLLEYFHDDWRKVDLVFGRDFNNNTGGLMESVEFNDLDVAADEVIDLSDVSDFQVPDYWNPNATSWNPEQFRTNLTR